MSLRSLFIPCALSLLILSSCQSQSEHEIKMAEVILSPKSGSKVEGKVTFYEHGDGVRIVAHVEGLTPGKHGFHIHEHGDCSAADGATAGGHFNPTSMPHGSPDDPQHHAGDLGNLEANAQGVAEYEAVNPWIDLNGPFSIVGKSIVVHQDEDDLTSQPAGNSGARIGCGTIVERAP